MKPFLICITLLTLFNASAKEKDCSLHYMSYGASEELDRDIVVTDKDLEPSDSTFLTSNRDRRRRNTYKIAKALTKRGYKLTSSRGEASFKAITSLDGESGGCDVIKAYSSHLFLNNSANEKLRYNARVKSRSAFLACTNFHPKAKSANKTKAILKVLNKMPKCVDGVLVESKANKANKGFKKRR